MASAPESTVEGSRGVENRGLPQNDRTIPGPTIEGTPRPEAGRRGPEPRLSPPPLVQAESAYSPPPLVQAEPAYSPPPLVQAESPFEPLPWPYPKRIDDDERGIAPGTRALTRSTEKKPGGRSAPQQAATPSTSISKAEWRKKACVQAEIDCGSWQPEKGIVANHVNVTHVYRYYMRVFNQNEDLLWAGMAKLAGGVVYRGFQQSQQVRSAVEEGFGLGGLEPSVVTTGRGTVAGYVTVVQVLLLKMQKEIFLDLAWQHQAYVEGGLAALEDAYARGEDVPIEAWRDIASGNRARVEFGNKTLLRREQETILPPYYKMIDDLPDMGVIPYVTSQFFTGSPIPGGRRFSDVVPGGDVTQFKDRWLWITSDMLPAYLRLDPKSRRELINRPLWNLGPFTPPAEEQK
jgi:hypothetical protein